MIQLAAALLALSLEDQNPFLLRTPVDTVSLVQGWEPWLAPRREPFPALVAPSIDGAPFSFDGEADQGLLFWTGNLVTVSESSFIAILGRKDRASGLFDDMDYRCALIVSRDKKNGWLVDRKENTAVRVDTQVLPEWCSE